MHTFKQLACAAVVSLGLFSAAAHAETLSFSYTFGSSDVLSGDLTGSLLGDNNTFSVTGWSNMQLGSDALTGLTTFGAYSQILGWTSNTPFVTLDGSAFDLSISGGGYGFNLSNDASVAALYGAGVAIGNSPNFGGSEFYNSANWSASLNSVAAVPEPETYAMLIAGLGMLGFIGRRRQRSG
jgi:hypothetical protein